MMFPRNNDNTYGKEADMAVYADFFVAVDGDDNDSGTEDEPFATIIRARNAVRELRQREPHRDVLVLMRGGTHYGAIPGNCG